MVKNEKRDTQYCYLCLDIEYDLPWKNDKDFEFIDKWADVLWCIIPFIRVCLL